MKHNRELLAKLQQQLKASTIKGDQLKKTVENLMKQLDEKEQQLQQLRAELDAKDIHISELDETINNQNTNISNLKTESSQKTDVINSQDRQLNTAWFVFGTKKELKEQQILVNGKVLQSNFNKSYFTKIDIRQNKEIKLNASGKQLYLGKGCYKEICSHYYESSDILEYKQILGNFSQVKKRLLTFPRKKNHKITPL